MLGIVDLLCLVLSPVHLVVLLCAALVAVCDSSCSALWPLSVDDGSCHRDRMCQDRREPNRRHCFWAERLIECVVVKVRENERKHDTVYQI